jgi:hypothetical protein
MEEKAKFEARRPQIILNLPHGTLVWVRVDFVSVRVIPLNSAWSAVSLRH